jgi:hypothetical protein
MFNETRPCRMHIHTRAHKHTHTHTHAHTYACTHRSLRRTASAVTWWTPASEALSAALGVCPCQTCSERLSPSGSRASLTSPSPSWRTTASSSPSQGCVAVSPCGCVGGVGCVWVPPHPVHGLRLHPVQVKGALLFFPV